MLLDMDKNNYKPQLFLAKLEIIERGTVHTLEKFK